MKLLIFILYIAYTTQAYGEELKSYIVELQGGSFLSEIGKRPILKNAEAAKAYKNSLIKDHDKLLSSLFKGREFTKVYDYVNGLNGFSAVLNEDQVERLTAHESVKRVFETKIYRPLVTPSEAKVLGLDAVSEPVWRKTTGKNIVIGVLDSGIFPESPSFNDAGLKPLSAYRICQIPLSGPPFKCNNKIVGARYFYSSYEQITRLSIATIDYASARDIYSHGTHVASTAAGSIVRNLTEVNTIRGFSFNSRIFVYKVCWGLDSNFGCSTSDILAALDASAEDGVDLISISLGAQDGAQVNPFYNDPFMMAMLEVTARGIPSVLAGGNAGGVGTIDNSAPWVLTVAASAFSSTVKTTTGSLKLKNGVEYRGSPSPDWGALSKSFYPLIISVSASLTSDTTLANLCYSGSLNPDLVRGKIVVCMRGIIDRVNKSLAVSEAGGIGMVMYNPQNQTSLFSDVHSVPSIHVSYQSGLEIIKFINSGRNPTATSISQFLSQPSIADFSSTGPNMASQYVLKPDIAAPGVGITAAISNFSSPVFLPQGSFVSYSGTSMATPQVAGAMALIKSLNKSWKPSWLYSAIITSGSTKSVQGKCIQDSVGYCASPFQMGGGHIDIRRAMDPGLVYNVDGEDYKKFLCTKTGGYDVYIKRCPSLLREVDFNFPSLSIPNFSGSLRTKRQLTLVGPPSTYRVSIQQPAGARVDVSPTALKFVRKFQTLSYNITVKALSSYKFAKTDYLGVGYTFGTITWSDGVRRVKLNVAVNVP